MQKSTNQADNGYEILKFTQKREYALQGKPSRSFGELLDLLLQFIEQRTGKELTKRDIKTITELFNGGDGHTLTGWVEHTIYRRWCYTGTGR